MMTHARGQICLCLTETRADELGLRLIADQSRSRHGTAYTATIDAREGIATGVSAADRSHTVQVAISPDSKPSDLLMGGHVQGLRARPGGVLERIGQTEAAIDLARLAGLNPSGVICEIANEDGTMARVPDLIPYCERHGLTMISIADLVEYRRRHEKLVERGAEVRLPTRYGEFTAVAFREKLTGKTHVALAAAARSTAPRTCSSASTPSASPATSSIRCAATAASSSSRRSTRSPARARASSSTWRRRAAASACSTS